MARGNYWNPNMANICVFCASSDHVEKQFFEAATRLGQLIGQGGHTLVFGGGRIGLMGAVARATHEYGGRIIGVIPHSMQDLEFPYELADEMIRVDTMRERKKIMDDRAHAFVALPGGFGTLEELIEVISHHYLDFHAKPVVIINIDGYYDPLRELFEHMIDHRFAKARYRDIYYFVNDPVQVFDYVT